MLSIEIRRPKAEDVPDLTDFFRLVVTDTLLKEGLGDWLDFIEEEIEIKKKYIYDDLNSLGRSRYFLLALYDGEIIGTIEYGPANDVIKKHTDHLLKDVVEIGTVFIHPTYQKQGVGTMLLNIMFLTLQNRGIEDFFLDSGYTQAQEVWKKKFGAADYLLKDFWGEGYDHMIWNKKVADIPIFFKA